MDLTTSVTSKREVENFSEVISEFKSLLNEAGIAFWYFSNKSKYVEVNQVYADILEKNKEEIEGSQLSQILTDSEEIKDCIAENRKVLEKEKQLTTTKEIYKTSNEKRLLKVTKIKVIDKDNNNEYIVCTGEDITREKQLQEQMEKSSSHYKKLVENLDEGITIVDEKENFIFANSFAEDLFGVEEGELIGRNMKEFVFAEESLEKITAGTQKRKQGKTGKYELEIISEKGKKKILDVVATPRWQGDKYEGAFSIIRDITERKQKEEELKLTQFSVNNASVGIIWINPQGKFEFVNDTICENLDYDREEILGRDISFIDPSYSRAARQQRWQSLKNKGKQIIETEHETREGEIIPVEVRSHYVNYKGQEYEFAFVQDISERKQAEKELKEQKEVIEKLHDTALKLRELNSEEEICQLTVDTAETLLDFKICNLSLIEGEMLIPRASSTGVPTGGEAATSVHEGIAGKTFREKTSYITDNIASEPEANPVSDEYKSAISVSIDEHGVFQAVATEKSAFSEEDLELAELLMSHTSAALDRIYSQQKIRYKTFHDELTGIYNRTYLEQEIERLDTDRQLPLSLIMIDINGLKIINDSFGHDKGDKLIKRTADLLKDCLREEDILARWAGDEFVILLPQTSREEAEKIKDRIDDKCEKTCDNEIPISLGIGLAVKENKDKDIYEVLNKADQNMYSSKLSKNEFAKNKMVRSLLNSLRSKSKETEEHATRMVKLAQKFGERLELRNSQIKNLSLLASLHDIGKVTISEEILNKPDDLTEEEWEIVKQHCERGYRIILPTEQFMPIAEEILCHHERWDGKGYPKGISGKDIPLLSRIISIIDAYEVMTNDQPYKESISRDEALEEIESCAGEQFDPNLAEEFVEMMA